MIGKCLLFGSLFFGKVLGIGRIAEVVCYKNDTSILRKGYIRGTNSSTYHVVIARYKEQMHHLRWLAPLSHTIYNRGDPLVEIFRLSMFDQARTFHSLNCPHNFGRESFIYFLHIIENYDKLPDVLIFSQAKHIFKAYTNEHFKSDVTNLITGQVDFNLKNDGFAFFVRSCASAWAPNHIHDLQLKYRDKEMPKILMTGYKDLLNFHVKDPRFAGTGCFAVRKENILRNPREYYISLAKTLLYRNDPIEGHFFERAWPEIFHSKCSAGKHFHCLWNSTITCSPCHSYENMPLEKALQVCSKDA